MKIIDDLKCLQDYVLFENEPKNDNGNIYIYSDKNEKNILYIGQTIHSVASRYRQHMNCSHGTLQAEWNARNVCSICWFEVPLKDLDLVESIMIGEYHSILNGKGGNGIKSVNTLKLRNYINKFCNVNAFSDFMNIDGCHYVCTNACYIDENRRAVIKYLTDNTTSDESIAVINNDVWAILTSCRSTYTTIRFAKSFKDIQFSAEHIYGGTHTIFVLDEENFISGMTRYKIDSVHEYIIQLADACADYSWSVELVIRFGNMCISVGNMVCPHMHNPHDFIYTTNLDNIIDDAYVLKQAV